MSKAMFQLNSERALLDGIERKNGETLYQNYEKAIQLGLVDEDVQADLQAYEKQGVGIFGLDASGKKVLLTTDIWNGFSNGTKCRSSPSYIQTFF